MRASVQLGGWTGAATGSSLAALGVTLAMACAGQRTAVGAAPGGSPDACGALPAAVLESSPLEAPYEFERVAAVHRFLWTGRGGQRTPVAHSGEMEAVLVTIHAPSWTTRDEMEVRLQCHLSWMRSTERGAVAMRSCPLGVPEVSAQVRMGFGQRFIIAIRSGKEAAAREVWRRASALAGTGGGASEDEADLE